MNPKLEIIDALIDGEPVDAGALRDALAESSGRDYLVDAWLLREAVQEDHAPAPALTCLRQARPDRRWLVAAALAGGLVVGFGLGFVTGEPTMTPPASTPAVTAIDAPTSAFPVPAPTRVIQIEF